METVRLSALDLSIVILYLLGVTGLGLWASRGIRSQRGFLSRRAVSPMVDGGYVDGRVRHRGEGHDRSRGRCLPVRHRHDEFRFRRLHPSAPRRGIPLRALLLELGGVHHPGISGATLQRFGAHVLCSDLVALHGRNHCNDPGERCGHVRGASRLVVQLVGRGHVRLGGALHRVRGPARRGVDGRRVVRPS